MVCIDTNIIIYIAKADIGEEIIGSQPVVYPSITKIEALGYPSMRSIEERKIRGLLDGLTEIPLNDNVIEQAIRLRQQQKLSLGDAIVAATALDNDCILWTANTDDFQSIEGLKLHNPLKNR